MIMDPGIRCSRESCRSSAVDPTQAKVRLEWGTHHLLPAKSRLKRSFPDMNAGAPTTSLLELSLLHILLVEEG
jgi:hypothetical protein